MKLSKTGWLLLTIGIFAVMFASMGATQSKQLSQQDQLNEELLLAKQRLDSFQIEQLSSQRNELEEELSQIISQSRSHPAKLTLSQSVDSTTTSYNLFGIAKTCGVEITAITSPGLSGESLEGLDCTALPLTVTVEGDVSSLIRFIIKLNDDFTTGVVKSVATRIPEPPDEEETASGETDEASDEETDETSGEESTAMNKKPSTDIRLLIYSYQGD